MITVDTELSGLDPEKNSLVSIGAIDMSNPKNQFYGECRVWEGSHINQERIDVAGFTIEQVTDPKKQTDEELIKKFIAWASACKEYTFAGQNPSTDYMFLRNCAKRYHLNWIFAYRTLDQHTLCYMHMINKGIIPPVSNNRTDLNSDKIMKYVGIPAEPRPHNALNGAKQAAEAISRLLYDKKLLPEFIDYPVPWII